MATVKFTFKQDPDTVLRFVTDPARVQARCEAFGERQVQVTANGGTVTAVRDVDAEVPGFAKKLLKPSNSVTDVKRWNATTRTATFTVDIKGVPVTISGDIRLSEAGAGTDYTVSFVVACRIPLIGGALAKHVTGLTEQGLRREYEWNQQALDRAT